MQIESLTDIWEAVCAELKKRMTEIAFNVWFKDLHPIEIRNGEIILGIYSDYKKQIIESNYMNVITPSIREIMGIDMDIKIVVEDENGRIITNKVAEVVTSLNDSYTFDNFIMGSCNRFAHAASMAVADNPHIVYNPLVIYGPSGVGKTHLMLAIRNRIKEKYPEKRIEYVRCEEFTTQLIEAIQHGTAELFRNRFRNLEVLLIDDIQFIANKPGIQEEIFHTFNYLYEDNKQIIFTSDKPPKDINPLVERLRTRFEQSMIADVQPPDIELRMAIIKKTLVIIFISFFLLLIFCNGSAFPVLCFPQAPTALWRSCAKHRCAGNSAAQDRLKWPPVHCSCCRSRLPAIRYSCRRSRSPGCRPPECCDIGSFLPDCP